MRNSDRELYRDRLKPVLDFVATLVALPFVLLIIGLAAPFVFLEDGRPIFYRSRRIGKNGRVFTMYKLRSMKRDAKDLRLPDGSTYNAPDDDRQTRTGRFLRVTSIDELPQIFNILKGEMSVIGPRPDPEDWLDRYDDRIRRFLNAKPGITGYTQAFYRCGADGFKKMECDLYYAENMSFALDMKILFKTIGMLFRHKNIYKEDVTCALYEQEHINGG